MPYRRASPIPRLAKPSADPIGVILLLALLTLLFAGLRGAAAETLPGTFARDSLVIETAAGTRHEFDVEVAITGAEKAQGLMFRRWLAPDAGMIFIYDPPSVAAMWMKNTFIPLDMIFIDREGRIVHIAERTVPQSLTPISAGKPVVAVLELNGGSAQRLGIDTGDRVVLPGR